VEATIEVRDNDDDRFCQQVGDLALDCINQGGVKFLHLIKRSDDDGAKDSEGKR
jgi:hypothetical protein